MNNDNTLYLDFLIKKEDIDNLLVPYINLITESGYKVIIKKTLVPNYYLVNDKLIILNNNVDVFYYFHDVPEMTLYFSDNILYINQYSSEGFIQ